MYHRVLEPGVDPWHLNVSPAHLAEQLEVLQRCMRPVSLRTLVHDRQSGAIDEGSVVVTFDDGYANNLHEGLPLLERFDVPATIFVAAGYTGADTEFWWDRLEQLILHDRPLPASLDLGAGALRRQWDLGAAAAGRPDLTSTASAAPAGSRMAFFHDLWLDLSRWSHDARRAALDELDAWVGAPSSVRASHRPMTAEEVVRVSAHPLMEIGAHTVTHPRLTDLPVSSQRHEIADARLQLESLTGGPVTSFSYPFGACTPGMRALLREAGYACAATTVEETMWHGSDPYALPRFMVEDWDGHEFERRLQQWRETR